MPMWNLSEEKVNELIRLMNDKKQEHDALAKKPAFSLWDDDLDAFLKALGEVEAKEEEDRLAGGGVNVVAGKKRKKKAAA